MSSVGSPDLRGWLYAFDFRNWPTPGQELLRSAVAALGTAGYRKDLDNGFWRAHSGVYVQVSPPAETSEEAVTAGLDYVWTTVVGIIGRWYAQLPEDDRKQVDALTENVPHPAAWSRVVE